MKYFYMINKFCNNLDIELTKEMYEKIILYMETLIEYNTKINLTAIRDRDDIISRHFLDSISVFNYKIKHNCSLCDVGTGAGFPGIPIKIIRDDIKLDLIEATSKKTKFLEHIVNILKLTNVNIINDRVEDISRNKEFREKYDYVVSRAMARLNRLLELSFPLVKISGYYIALKGENVEQEILESKEAIVKLGGNLDKRIKINEFNSSLVIVKKLNKTPYEYPRKYKIILNNSL